MTNRKTTEGGRRLSPRARVAGVVLAAVLGGALGSAVGTAGATRPTSTAIT